MRCRPPLRHQHHGLALTNEPAVVRFFVLVFELGSHLTGALAPDTPSLTELVGKGKQKGDKSLLIAGIGLENIEANALGGLGVVE